MRYVIVGNSVAAVGCIEGIRQRDPVGEILVFGEEDYPVYSRPLISYWLSGKTGDAHMRYRPADFYEKNRCTLHTGVTVTALDPAAHTVTAQPVAGGEAQCFAYDKLLIATGSRPFVPPVEGLDTVTHAFPFMKWDDARALKAALTPSSRVLVLGAGLIGLKCAEALAGRVRALTVVDMAPQVLPSILDADAASRVQTHLEAHGIAFRLGCTAQAFHGDSVRLSDGTVQDFDVLVTAVGVRARTELVAQAGGTVRRGIATDCFGRTDLPDVYAAGDCAESYDRCLGQERVLALLPNAYRQGECAGLHMSGSKEKPYENAIAMNAIGFFGLHMLTAGIQEGEAFVTSGEGMYKKLFVKDNRLMGYILLGDVRCAGIYTALVREATPLDSLDFERIREKPQLMAFSRKARQGMLAQAH